VTIPDAINGYPVTSIGEYAFYYYTSLTNVSIPNSVTSIGEYAFENCGLTRVMIPNSVTNIGELAFASCTSLTNITVIAGNPDYSSTNGVLFNENQTTLIQYPIGLTNANYIITNSVASIGEEAFCDCPNLTSVTMGNSVTSIGAGALSGCTSLTSVTMGNSVTNIGEYAFFYCPSLTNIIIPNSVTRIGEEAFYQCFDLTSVTMGSSVTRIGEEAFVECTNLTSVTFLGNAPGLADPTEFIDDGVVANAVYYYYGTSGWSSTYGGLPTTMLGASSPFTYTTNSGAITITGYTGAGGAVTMPDSLNGYPVSSIGEYAFVECSSLTSVTLPNSVTSIGANAFLFCSSLTSVTLPNSITSIGEFAFADCSSLASITIGNNVTSIGGYAFADCFSLTSVTIPNSVTSIGGYAFAFCTSLTNITVNAENPAYSSMNGILFNQNQTTLIQYPVGLTNASYTIPNSVTNIGDGAFGNCTKLTSITFSGNAPGLGDATEFTDDHISPTLYYHYGTSGWRSTYGGLPTVELFMPPQISGGDGQVGVSSGKFSFTVTGMSNQTIVVEASTNLANWQPVWTNTLSGTATNFTDPQWKNYPHRFYRAQ